MDKHKQKETQEKINKYIDNHKWLKYTLDYGKTLFMTLLSAVIFAFGIRTFISPTSLHMINIVSGGVSGISQTINLIVEMIFPNIDSNGLNISYSIAYFVCNIPIIFIAFKKISVRFGAFSLINILTVTILTSLDIDIINQIASFVGAVVKLEDGTTIQTGLLARAIFAGICTGLSSGLAFKAELSTGGLDVISYYFSLKKSTNVGKYTVFLNSIILCAYTILTIIDTTIYSSDKMTSLVATSVAIVFFSAIYQFTVGLLVDTINVRNKKVQLQIISRKEDLYKYLLANVPHGATIIDSKGAFTGEKNYIINMVISSIEERRVVSLIREFDPDSFVNAINLRQVYGRFYIRPVK